MRNIDTANWKELVEDLSEEDATALALALLEEEERRYETTFDIKVLGHIFGAEDNQERPKIVIRQSITNVIINRERTIFGDIPRHIEKGYYRGPRPKERNDKLDDC